VCSERSAFCPITKQGGPLNRKKKLNITKQGGPLFTRKAGAVKKFKSRHKKKER
jgi:hypothetical protein